MAAVMCLLSDAIKTGLRQMIENGGPPLRGCVAAIANTVRIDIVLLHSAPVSVYDRNTDWKSR
jgi:hypothetical protein